MNRETLLALNLILSYNLSEIAYAGGGILSELCIRDPSQWAGNAETLGQMIFDEVLDKDHHYLKPKYIIAADNLTEHSLVGGTPRHLSFLILRVAAVNLLTRVREKSE